MMDWIPVEKKLPDDCDWVIVTQEHDGDYYVNFAQFVDGKFVDLVWDDELNVIAWMPTPTPFQRNKEEK